MTLDTPENLRYRIWALETALDGAQAQLDHMHDQLMRIARAAGVDTDQVQSVMVGAIIDRLQPGTPMLTMTAADALAALEAAGGD